MTDTPPPAWAIEKVREIVADGVQQYDEMLAEGIRHGKLDNTYHIEHLARALAAERADTEARVERETIERCAEVAGGIFGYENDVWLKSTKKEMAALMANSIVDAIRNLPAKYPKGDAMSEKSAKAWAVFNWQNQFLAAYAQRRDAEKAAADSRDLSPPQVIPVTITKGQKDDWHTQ